MNTDTVFIGGSRQLSRLPADVKERLRNIIDKGLAVVVGDAGGADKAVQKYMADAAYPNVTVFCSGPQPRNNLGQWPLHPVTPKAAKGFQFYAAKDRAMAVMADYGLMIWDGKSPGTVLNILRLVRTSKKAVLINVPAKSRLTFKVTADWDRFLATCPDQLVSDLRERATAEEWQTSPAEPMSAPEPAAVPVMAAQSGDALTADINNAFARNDLAAVVDLLGSFAKAQGMANVAKSAGVSRESLYRSLRAEGNPEFSTILKVVESLGLRLSVSKAGQGMLALGTGNS